MTGHAALEGEVGVDRTAGDVVEERRAGPASTLAGVEVDGHGAVGGRAEGDPGAELRRTEIVRVPLAGRDLDGLGHERLGAGGGLLGGGVVAERRRASRARPRPGSGRRSRRAASAASGRAAATSAGSMPVPGLAGDDLEGAVDQLDGRLGGRHAVVALERDVAVATWSSLTWNTTGASRSARNEPTHANGPEQEEGVVAHVERLLATVRSSSTIRPSSPAVVV